MGGGHRVSALPTALRSTHASVAISNALKLFVTEHTHTHNPSQIPLNEKKGDDVAVRLTSARP